MVEDDEGEERPCGLVGAWTKSVSLVRDASEEVMLLWGLQQPTLHRPNQFVRQGGKELRIEACGRRLSIFQVPSSLSQVGVTGGVVWDSGVILAMFLEHAVDSHFLVLQRKRLVELGSGCGLVGCVASLLGAHTILTDVPDRLKLLQKNVNENAQGAAAWVMEHIWGDSPQEAMVQPQLPEFVVAADVIYNEDFVPNLLSSLRSLCGSRTTVFLSSELRNYAVLEYFFEAAMVDFVIGRVPIDDWHPEFRSSRVALYAMCRRSQTCGEPNSSPR